MKKLSKQVCSLGLTALVLLGTVLSGCAQGNDYTAEIREYQAKLESLQAENEALRQQLEAGNAVEETQSEAAAETEETLSQSAVETETAVETVQEETEATATAEETSSESGQEDEDLIEVLVLGDSIWGNYRDNTGIAAKVEYYMGKLGYSVRVYNAAIGGTRATVDPGENEWQFGGNSENSLGKMLSVLDGKTEPAALQNYPDACAEMEKAIARKSELDWVIIAYGMNDFLNQVPPNDSEHPWTGFGTALRKGAGEVERICPDAKIMLATPAFGSYFPNGVQNMGDRALFKYAEVAGQAANDKNTYFINVYDKLGINPYNADEYLEDGVHLNEKGRDLYARSVVSDMVRGKPGQVSGNAMEFED